MSGKGRYHPKYYSKKLFSTSCNSKHVYGEFYSNKFFSASDIHGDTYTKAIAGFRDSSIKIYQDFINQYETNGAVTGCTLDWVYSAIKIIVDIDHNQLIDISGESVDIPPNKKAQEILNALGLSNKKANHRDALGSAITVSLHCPKMEETTTQETKRIIKELKISNLYEDPHLRITINNNTSMTNIISKIRNKIRKSSK